MKRTLFSVACLALTCSLQAQNYFPSTGNAGIGTSTPDYALSIYSSSGSSSSYIKVEGANTQGVAGLGLYNNQGNGLQLLNSGSNFSGLGIGESRANNAMLAYNGIGHLFIGTNQSVSDLGFSTGSQRRMTILGSGNIGIGNAAPAAQLELTAPAAAIGDRMLLVTPANSGGSFAVAQGTSVTNAFLPSLEMRSSGRDGIGGYLKAYVPVARDVLDASLAGMTFSARAIGDVKLTTANLFAWKNNDDMVMVLNKDGYLGIGTAAPDAELAVNGTIHAKEVKVNTTGFPDYVFFGNYKLRPLTEVGDFIARHHHLPEMPSATEVERDGLNLGEMNKLLTRKVEELTLYMIRQDQMLREQKQLLTGQQKALRQLNRRLARVSKGSMPSR